MLKKINIENVTARVTNRSDSPAIFFLLYLLHLSAVSHHVETMAVLGRETDPETLPSVRIGALETELDSNTVDCCVPNKKKPVSNKNAFL